MAQSIRVEGLQELQRALRAAGDTEVPKRLGQANKQIGELVISKLEPRPDPAAVGVGSGSAVRASAAKREVLLRVGGAHRPKPPLSVWGKKTTAPVGQRRPLRPNILGTVERHHTEIEDAYLEAVTKALRTAVK